MFLFHFQPSPSLPILVRTFSRDDPIQIPDNPEDIPPPDPSLFGAPPPPATVEEALQQRLAKYREDEAKAKQVNLENSYLLIENSKLVQSNQLNFLNQKLFGIQQVIFGGRNQLWSIFNLIIFKMNAL